MSGLIDISCIKVEQQQEEETLAQDMSCDIDIGPIKIEPEWYEATTPKQEKQLPASRTK